MSAAGFWDDQEHAAAGVLRARARGAPPGGVPRRWRPISRTSASSRRWPPRTSRVADEVEEQRASIERRLAALEEARLFSGDYDGGDAVVTVNAGAGGTDSQDWAEMLLRTEMRWADQRGMKTELLEASPGEEAGIKSATFLARGENAYGLFSAEKGVHRLVRISPFDSASRRHTAFAGRRGGAVRGEHHRDRHRARRPSDRHLPRVRGGRPAREQDRLGGAHHPQAHAARWSSARTSARRRATRPPPWPCSPRS